MTKEGRTYYYNRRTKQSAWEKPDSADEDETSALAAAAAVTSSSVSATAIAAAARVVAAVVIIIVVITDICNSATATRLHSDGNRSRRDGEGIGTERARNSKVRAITLNVNIVSKCWLFVCLFIYLFV